MEKLKIDPQYFYGSDDEKYDFNEEKKKKRVEEAKRIAEDKFGERKKVLLGLPSTDKSLYYKEHKVKENKIFMNFVESSNIDRILETGELVESSFEAMP